MRCQGHRLRATNRDATRSAVGTATSLVFTTMRRAQFRPRPRMKSDTSKGAVPCGSCAVDDRQRRGGSWDERHVKNAILDTAKVAWEAAQTDVMNHGSNWRAVACTRAPTSRSVGMKRRWLWRRRQPPSVDSTISFVLSAAQTAQVRAWQIDMEQRIPALNLESFAQRFSGAYTFTFTPSAIGTVVMVRHLITGAVLDLTDSDSVPAPSAPHLHESWRKRS